jgi:hypothetical protein
VIPADADDIREANAEVQAAGLDLVGDLVWTAEVSASRHAVTSRGLSKTRPVAPTRALGR